MSRQVDSHGRPEPLDADVIEKFVQIGIPYRLAMLQFAEEVSPAKSTRDSAFVEAAIVSGRLLLQFLGLGIDRRGGLKLVQRRDYYVADGQTDEVKAPDVGGRFVDITSLNAATKETLAQFHHGASKASAHLTWDSGHELDLANLKQSIPIIRELIQSHVLDRENVA